MPELSSLISIIIPVYNCEKYIDDAIESILSQDYSQLEIIVVDDGSTDNSAKIIKSYNNPKIKYLYQENLGPAAARNKGIKFASGDFIAFLDADDLWPENKLIQQLKEFMNNDELNISMGKIKYVELPDATRNNRMLLDPDDTFKYVNLGAGLFKKDVFDKVGYFDEKFMFWEDLDWFLRAYEKNVSLKFIESVVLLYRVHSDNMSNNSNEVEFFLDKVLRNSIKRRKRNKIGLTKSNSSFLKFLTNPK